jgi:hypothetical protein
MSQETESITKPHTHTHTHTLVATSICLRQFSGGWCAIHDIRVYHLMVLEMYPYHTQHIQAFHEQDRLASHTFKHHIKAKGPGHEFS